MTRLRRTAGLASAALLTFALSACGGSDYCDLIESGEDDLGNVAGADFTDPDAIAPIQERMQEIADAAPDEVTDQWQNVADGLQTMADAAGDPSALDEDALADLQSMQSDFATISENVEEECDVDVNL